jgi:Ca2+-transporting ATPase
LHHVDISSVADIVRGDTMRQFVADLGSQGDAADLLTRYELGVFFSIFVVMQFWNMFNAKYFHSNRSLLLDLVDLVRRPAVVKESYSLYFVLIAIVILLGQVIIVNFAGDLFGVAPLPLSDWAWILLLTSPILFIPDIVRLVRR